MNEDPLFHLKYPIGKFSFSDTVDTVTLQKWIEEVESLPIAFGRQARALTITQLDTPYRPGGWTGRQVIHHVVDSHMNSYVRYKWTLTEDQPTIKPYFEDRWATLADSQHTPIETSIQMLHHLHHRWVHLLKSLSPEEWARTYTHPEHGKLIRLDQTLGLYAWHGKHHLGHLQILAG